jgi:hypothetical protein
VLSRRPEPSRRSVAAFLFAPTYYDVFDHRLGVAIGALEVTGGFIRPARTLIYDSSQRVVGRVAQPLAALLGCWLLVGRDRYNVIVNDLRVARIGWTSSFRTGELEVDATGAAGLLDPRLILACAVEKAHGSSSY